MVVRVTGRIEGHQAHDVSRAKVWAWDSGWAIVILCECGEKFVLTEDTSAGGRGSKHPSTAKEGFYSWLDDYQGRLVGKEERGEYYTRFEEKAVPR